MNTNNWTVIVVEDTFDDWQLASAILNHYGIEVHVVQNGRQCLTLLEDIKPTAVLTDLSMPEMDGWETLEQIRANAETANLPVIAVTAYHSVDVAHDAMKAGFDAYFAKPLSPQTFVDELTRILNQIESS